MSIEIIFYSLIILIAIIFFTWIIIFWVKNERHYSLYNYWKDNLQVDFHFDEIAKDEKYFIDTYGINYADKFDFKVWIKNGKKGYK